MVVAPVNKILHTATIPRFMTVFRGTDAEGTFKSSTGEYLLPDGGVVYFRSAEKPEYLEGPHVAGAWLDEAGQMKRWAWVVIQARVGLKQGRVLFTSTPYGRNWFYHEIFEQWRKGSPYIDVIQFSSITNPHYPTDEFERMKTVLSQSEFSMRYLGMFENPANLFFPSFHDCVVDEVRYPEPGDRRYGGIDFGWTAPSAVLSAFQNDVGEVWIYREFYEPKALVSDLAAQMDVAACYFADPSSPREIEELTKAGFDVRQGFRDFQSGIRKVNEFISSGRLKIPAKICPNLISEAACYAPKEGEEKPPRGANDHLMDALRYLLCGIDTATLSDVGYLRIF